MVRDRGEVWWVVRSLESHWVVLRVLWASRVMMDDEVIVMLGISLAMRALYGLECFVDTWSIAIRTPRWAFRPALLCTSCSCWAYDAFGKSSFVQWPCGSWRMDWRLKSRVVYGTIFIF